MDMKDFLKNVGTFIFSAAFFSALSLFIFIPAFAIAEFANNWWGLFVALIGSAILTSVESCAMPILAIPMACLLRQNPIGKYISMIMCIIVSIVAIILIWIYIHPTKWVLATMIVLTLKNMFYAFAMCNIIATFDN